MHLRKVNAIIWKQLKDTGKNKAVLIQFIMFPILAIIMEISTDIEGLEDNYFVMLFATMYIGMAPLTAMASIISEEKEKFTLRMLIMSNVKAQEYLMGVGTYIMAVCAMGALVFGVTAGYSGINLIVFVTVMLIGLLLSTLLGGVIGVWSKNQMMATSVVVPVMIAFSFLPMIAMFNESVEVVSRLTYSQQINYMMKDTESLSFGGESIGVLTVNLVIILVLFSFAYKRSKLA